MANRMINEQLLAIADTDDFEAESAELAAGWSAAGVGPEGIAPILQFIETHPDLDYGNPGPLVHFVEEFHRAGYEEELVDSIRRKPTGLTAWMLNRLINGTPEAVARSHLISTMRQAATHPGTDGQTLQDIRDFLEHLED